MSKIERSLNSFKEGFLCSQAILSTYGPELNLDAETALKISAALGGGISRMGDICGAVSGAILVISLKHGHTRAGDSQSKEITYSLVREFADKFKSLHGSIKCRDLLGCDISTAEGLSLAKGNDLFTTVCPKFVASAAQIMEQVAGLG